MDFGIIDAHAHIFPPLAGACGFPDAATHLLHQQRAMHVHGNQPYRRARDNALVSERPLWAPDDPSEAGRTDADFRVGRCGRFEWRAGGYGREELERAGAYRVYADPAEMLARIDELGVRTGVAT
ncbi:MAG: hypothetical protein WBQ75_01745 [Acetobacteraceae bacterium]